MTGRTGGRSTVGEPRDGSGRPGRPVRVLIVDDDALVRAGLRTILSAAPDVEVVAEVADGSQVTDAVSAHRPDVVLMDIRMPEVDGITATARVRERPDPPEVVVLTTFHADEYVFGALRAGASGFLLKDTPPTEIISAVRLVVAGEAMLSPSVTRTLIDRFGDRRNLARRREAIDALGHLTSREREVAAGIGEGLANAEIAAALHMSEATVKAHVSRVLAKLGATNRVQVALIVQAAVGDL
jgi:DNA-binding NarL/FixJ family response regulator